MPERRLRPTEFTRHYATELKGHTGLYYHPTDNEIIAEHKARLYLKKALRGYSAKVGAVGSRNPVGQTAQAGGSILLPGNASPVRSPIRSGVARALTPGGGRNRLGLPDKPERGYRCAEGFQFGGRFTDANYTTCGKQLFDVPSLKETLAQSIYRTRGRRKPEGDSAASASVDVSVVAPNKDEKETQLMMRRAARVPKVGEGKESERSKGIKQAIKDIQNQDDNSAVLVRRDGYSMVPVVSEAELRKVPDNRNMEEAAWIKSVRQPEQLGGEELGLLSNTGVTTLVYVAPNGVTIRLDRTRNLETGERRQLGKDVNTATDMDVKKDPLARLNFIADKSDGAFKLSTDYGDVKNPDQLTAGGKNKDMPKWAVEAFIDAPDPRTEDEIDLDGPEADAPDADTPEVEAPDAEMGDADTTEAPEVSEPEADAPATVAPRSPEDRIDSVKEAVEHLRKGGLLADIDPSVLYEALQRVEGYKKRELRDDITLFQDPSGKKFLLKENNQDFEHISAHLSSEVLREMGVQAPAVKFAGSESDRPFVYRSPDNVIEGAELDRDIGLGELPAERIVGIQVADWLVDTRDRSPASVVGVRVDEEVDVVANIGPSSALIGLDADELEARRQVGIEEFFQATTSSYGRTFADATEEDKALMIQILDSLLERANEFSWDEYRDKLSADGVVSEAEQRHLEIVQALFTNRLEQLTASKELIQQILGLA